MNDSIAIAIAVLLGVLASVPVALVIAVAQRQPRDVVDFSGWYPPDESAETPETALYFDAQWREVTP